MSENNALVVTVAHDYQCPWCWFSLFQAKRLKQEFPKLCLDWRGYELLPDPSRWPEHRPAPNQRLKDLARLDSIDMPKAWPRIVSSHPALEGAEYVKDRYPDLFDAYNEAVYRAFWDRAEDISNMVLLSGLAEAAGVDPVRFREAVEAEAYRTRIIPFREAAYENGITHVTTFRFLGEQCAEAPYSTIRELADRFQVWYG